MLLAEYVTEKGGLFFRWRSYILLVFAPLVILAISNGEQIEQWGGETAEMAYATFCIALAIAGQVIRALTIGYVPEGTSGRNTSAQIATRLNTTGMYSQTRNPLYVGNCLSIVAILLYPQNLYLGLVAVLFLIIYYGAIIMAEESFLTKQFGAEYLDWSKNVNAFIPNMSGWTSPDLPFSWQFVLRREHSSWYSVFIPLFLIVLGQQYVEYHAMPSAGWFVALAIVTAIYVGLIIVKKKTRLLDVLRLDA